MEFEIGGSAKSRTSHRCSISVSLDSVEVSRQGRRPSNSCTPRSAPTREKLQASGSVLVVVIAVGCVAVAVVNIVHVVVMRDSFMAAVFTVDVVGMRMGLVVITHWVNICVLMH